MNYLFESKKVFQTNNFLRFNKIFFLSVNAKIFLLTQQNSFWPSKTFFLYPRGKRDFDALARNSKNDRFPH